MNKEKCALKLVDEIKLSVVNCCNSAVVIRLSAATHLENKTGILKALK